MPNAGRLNAFGLNHWPGFPSTTGPVNAGFNEGLSGLRVSPSPERFAPITGVNDVEPKMRNLGSTASEALRSVKVKISDVYFLIALANGDQNTARNLDLMQTRAWFDFPLLLNDNRIAKLVLEKSTTGEAMLAKAFEAWK